MKTLLPFLLMLFLLSGCGRYVTTSGGQEDVGYVTVVKANPKAKFKNVELIVDGKSYFISKVQTPAKAYKVRSVTVAPGKHRVQVLYNGVTLTDENVLVGLQETRKIVLQ